MGGEDRPDKNDPLRRKLSAFRKDMKLGRLSDAEKRYTIKMLILRLRDLMNKKPRQQLWCENAIRWLSDLCEFEQPPEQFRCIQRAMKSEEENGLLDGNAFRFGSRLTEFQ